MKPAKTEGDWFNDDCLNKTKVEQRVQEQMTYRIERKNNDSECREGSPRCLGRWLELVLKVSVIYDVFSLLVLFLAYLRGADRG